MIWAILFLLFTLKSNPILASERNIFGLHLTQTADLDSAKNIINSSGGDWGYVTVVIRTDQLDKNTWQEFFDNCRKYHIIPIIRLATIMENNFWKIPSESDIDNLANLLNSLNWPMIPKYIMPFNEIDLRERKEAVNRVLGMIKEDESLLLRLYYLGELSINEIKEITGYKDSKIKVTLLRARKSFQEKLEKIYGFEITLLT